MKQLRKGRLIAVTALAILLVAMALDTAVVRIGSAEDTRGGGFSPDSYGKRVFPEVQAAVKERAVEATVLAAALQKDQAAALAQYGVQATIGSVVSVRFSGVAEAGEAGVYHVAVPGLPDDIRIQIQTGPAINGTVLRDATGTISFGQFRNQIEYQDAGSALNNEMKKNVLAKIDTSRLTGKSISVVGAFLSIHPKNWLVTPVELSVES